MKHLRNGIGKVKLNTKQTGLLIISLLHLLPAQASEQPTISVVVSSENVNQWVGISNRLQAAGVKYCVIPINTVRTAGDWGDRKILFLPNVEILSPSQAIALEDWVNKGGKVIATGPVGSLSAPGVRQLLRMLLGGYWGFSLNEAQKLEASKDKTQAWANQKELLGQAQGGVVIADDAPTTVAALWNSQDNHAAVLATQRSTFLGWRWGVDTASSAELDTAWLRAALKRHATANKGEASTIAGGSTNCSPTLEAALGGGQPIQAARSPNPQPTTNQTPPPKVNQVPVRENTGQNIVTAPQTRPIEAPSPRRGEEAIDQLEERVRLDVNPNSNAPISRSEAIALQQELNNLIGRVESSYLAASAISGNATQAVKGQRVVEFAALDGGGATQNINQALEQARNVANNLPKLIAERKFAQARQQWLAAKGILWRQYPLDRMQAQPEIRAFWLDRGTIVRAGSERGLAVIFDRMAQAGINTVFFETVNSSYTIYPSQVAPQQNPLIRGWDPLAAAVKLARERGMEIHAWVWVFAAGNQKHNEVLNIDRNYPGPVLAANPDWAGYDNRGQKIPVGQGKPFFDPANPAVRQYLLRLYEEIVTRYDVDGLQLDYIRYPFQDPSANRTYGYGQAARTQFQQLYGVDPAKITPSQRDLWQKWTAFRTEQVNSFVAQVSQQLKQKRPNLIMSVAVFPLPESERIQKIQQHWEVWARRGDIDLIVPMTYALDTPRFQRLAEPWIASSQLGSTLLVPGIRLLNLPSIGAFDQIQLVRDLPTSGYALFATENFNNDLHQLFRNTQGRNGGSTKEPIPHRQPFQSAAARYEALHREWKFVLQNNELRISGVTASDFNSQAEVLQNALDQLAKEPSRNSLVTAKGALTRFQTLFRAWMRDRAASDPYQVRVWENRLEAISRLLRYGERVQLSR